MDFYTFKVKILDEIAKSTPLLSPRDDHVYGNWHIQSWEAQRANFPIVTVRMSGELIPMWSFHTPTLQHGELYAYDFSLFVFGDSMHSSRAIADIIIDYFQMNNKFPDVKIVDVINFTSKESILQKGPKRYWRTIVSFRVLTEEDLTQYSRFTTMPLDILIKKLGISTIYGIDSNIANLFITDGGIFSQVSTVISPAPTRDVQSRKVFFDGTNYFTIWHDYLESLGNRIYYSSSSNGINWSAKTLLFTGGYGTISIFSGTSNSDWILQKIYPNSDVGYSAAGQSFQPPYDYVLTRARFYLKKVGNPTGYVAVAIFAHTGTFGTNGVPTGSPIAISDYLDVSTLTTSYVQKLFEFQLINRPTLTANTSYFAQLIVISGTYDGSNYVHIAGTAAGGHAGNAAYYQSNGWSSSSADRRFTVEGYRAIRPYGSFVDIEYPNRGDLTPAGQTFMMGISVSANDGEFMQQNEYNISGGSLTALTPFNQLAATPHQTISIMANLEGNMTAFYTHRSQYIVISDYSTLKNNSRVPAWGYNAGGVKMLRYKTTGGAPYRILVLVADNNSVLNWDLMEGTLTTYVNPSYTALVTLAAGFSTFSACSEATALGAPERCHIVYIKSTGELCYNKFESDAWGVETVLVASGASHPVIAVGSSGQLYVLFIKGGVLVGKKWTALKGWTDDTQLFTSHTYNNIQYPSICQNAQSGKISVVWSEGTGPYEIWFASWNDN